MVQGYNHPINQIIADLDELITHEYEVGANATPAEMLPGSSVIFDTVDGSVKEAGAEADDFLGVLDVQGTEGVTHQYEVGEQCRVIEHGKCMVRFKAGGTGVTPGLPIVTGADGTFTAQAVGLQGEQGAPVGYALETNTHVGADFVLVMITGQREASTT
jgi:hypothetical protein